LSERRRLLIVGDGPEREAVRACIQRFTRGNFVTMLGARGDVEKVLAAFDVFALTSRTEGLPLVLLEAMATGLPVVSTAVGGVPDLIRHGDNGLLVREGGAGGTTALLASLAENRDRARALGDAGIREIHARYSMDDTARAYDALYREELSARRAMSRRASAPRSIALA
jgi:glycosyltransferase involved in cell wall biosynthesis